MNGFNPFIPNNKTLCVYIDMACYRI